MDEPWSWRQIRSAIEDTASGYLFVLGSTGVGKTYAVTSILSDMMADVDVFVIDSQNCASCKDLHTLLDRQLNTSLVQNLTGRKRRIIVIDELETLYQLDKSLFTFLSGLQPKHLVVCTGHISLDKKLRSSFSKIIMFSALPEADICLLLKKLYPQAGCDAILEAAETCYGNLSHAIQMIRLGDSDQRVTKKDDATCTFDYVFKSNNIEHVSHIIHEDPWLNPLRYHENLPKELSQRKGTQQDKHAFYTKTLDALCNWDVMMQHSMNADVPIEYILRAILQIHNLQTKKTQTERDLTEFTKLFSNLSLQRKTEKLLYSYSGGFPWLHAQIFCDYIKYK